MCVQIVNSVNMTHDYKKALRYLRGYFKKRGDLFNAINAYEMPTGISEFRLINLNKIATGQINVAYCYPIELVTQGEVTRHMLRPDFFEEDGSVKKPNLKQDVEPKIPKIAE